MAGLICFGNSLFVATHHIASLPQLVDSAVMGPKVWRFGSAQRPDPRLQCQPNQVEQLRALVRLMRQSFIRIKR